MENQAEQREARRHQIGDRIADIRVRLSDLQQPRGDKLAAAEADRQRAERAQTLLDSHAR